MEKEKQLLFGKKGAGELEREEQHNHARSIETESVQSTPTVNEEDTHWGSPRGSREMSVRDKKPCSPEREYRLLLNGSRSEKRGKLRIHNEGRASMAPSRF